MEVRIGVQNVSRELVLDSEQSADDVSSAVEKALQNGSGVLTLTERAGRRLVVPVSTLAYVDIGPGSGRKVGFGAMAD